VYGRYFRIYSRSKNSSRIRIIEFRVVPSTIQGIGYSQSHSDSTNIDTICRISTTTKINTNTALHHGNRSRIEPSHTFEARSFRQVPNSDDPEGEQKEERTGKEQIGAF
jgi:hypothetical protein